eukprot:Plantae.Rhodophyta-Purpureofilum_apyrenoidigerum.ctg16119.p1 GENE.Plantae.Rhodophyta-Purpureofilum_apyrenoidigerum.ctg16119~~Plantae.Rhodophyta-Purpureofilum_apyrenoidigerum.ctg16119.p1  ORF type:complete len:347 (+),score=52.82 Plantae.Rhodophyta-Purpureofilum_apyrenoidigerum.ctg16119:66-1106(+)
MVDAGELNALFEQALAFYDGDKLFQAMRAFERLEAAVNTAVGRGNEIAPQDRRVVEKIRHRLENDSQILEMKKRSKECLELLLACESTDGWEMKYDGQSTKVLYKREAGTPIHSVKAEGTISAEFLHLASLIYETDLYPQFWWFVREMKNIKKIGRCCKAIQGIYQAFWPIYDREVPLIGYAVDGFDEDNCMLLFFRSLQPDDTDRDGTAIGLPQKPSRSVRIDLKIAGMKFVPVGRNATKITLVCNLDPKIASVPVSLTNWATRSVFRASLRMLEVKANDLDGMPHMERMRNDPFYTWLSGRLDEYFEKHGDALDDCAAVTQSSFDITTERAHIKPPKIALLGLR